VPIENPGIELPDSEVHLWYACWAPSGSANERSASTADAAAEPARPHRPIPLRFRGGRELVRRIVAPYLGQAPEQVRIERTCVTCGRQHGRPVLVDAPEIALSVSYSSDEIVVAVARRQVLGVDLERVVPVPIDQIAREFCVGERDSLLKVSHARRLEAFFVLWTRKEAVAKATGWGLAFGLDRFEVAAPLAAPRITRAAAELPKMADWLLEDIARPPGWACSIAYAPPRATIRCFNCPGHRTGTAIQKGNERVYQSDPGIPPDGYIRRSEQSFSSEKS
jgi:4'-phosphopantetheinyl transferase